MPLRQSFAWWSFSWGQGLDPASFLRGAADIGYAGVEMLEPEHWPLARDLGLDLVTITGQASMDEGFNDVANHGALQDEVGANIELAAREAVGALIVFAGRRGERNDAAAAEVAADGLAALAAQAEAVGVTLLLELLNSRVDHLDYQGDHTEWGVDVVRRVGSPGLRLLYDVYHMQIMEGDVIRTVSRVVDLIGHIHTAGVPGRHDLDDRQELNYGPIIRSLSKSGYDRFVGHEFLPRGAPLQALRSAFELVEDAATTTAPAST